MISTLTTGVFVTALVLAGASDLRSRRIPNNLTVSALILALVLRGVLGSGAFVEGLLGAGLALLLLFPLFALGGVGGGDAKLLIMAGAFLGPWHFLVALLATAVVGGVLSLAAAARNGALLPVLLNTGDLLKYCVTFGFRGKRGSLASPGVLSVPYGVAIGLGSMAAIILGGGL